MPGKISKELDAATQRLNANAVGFVIDGVRDDAHRRELSQKIQSLKDSDTGDSSFTSDGAYHQRDTYFRVSPIRDIEDAANRIDFGRVLSVDPKERTILVDAAAERSERPADGWPGSKAFEQYILQQVRNAATPYQGLVDKFGRDKVVVIWAPEESMEEPGLHPSPDKHPMVTELRKFAPETLASSSDFGPRHYYFVMITVAPVSDLADVVKKFEGISTLVIDEERRSIIVADLADLKPIGAKTSEQPVKSP
ncbi:MAG: hypothetical protein HY290_27475 [Planctomycetia bacterium]|nr:hypothetical protein [Planctomycetia bacterium]